MINHIIICCFIYILYSMLGQFQPSIFFKSSSIIISVSIIAIYWISQYYQHQKPFPECWISGCAGHYPQYIIFRITTIGGPVLLILGWLTNNFYLMTIGKQKVFRVKKYHPEIAAIMGIMGSLLLMGSTANIDTGKRNGTWHQHCAAGFFVFTLLSHIYNTIVFIKVYRQIKTVSLSNLYFKVFILGLQIIQVIIAQLSGIVSPQFYKIESTTGIFLEWSLSFTFMLYIYSMSLDVKNFKLIYQLDRNQQQQLKINN